MRLHGIFNHPVRGRVCKKCFGFVAIAESSENIVQNMHMRGKSGREFAADSKKLVTPPVLKYPQYRGIRSRWGIMQICSSTYIAPKPPLHHRTHFSKFGASVAEFVTLLAAGCGATAEPAPPLSRVCEANHHPCHLETMHSASTVCTLLEYCMHSASTVCTLLVLYALC